MAQPQFTGLDLLSTIACENALNGVATSSSSRSSRSGYTTPPDGDGGSQRSFTAASEGVDVSGGPPGSATARLDVFGAAGEPGSRLLHPPRPLFGSGSSCSPFRPLQPFQSQIVHPPPHSVVHSGGPVHGGHHAYAPKGHPHRYHHGAPGAPGSVRMGSNHPSPYRSPEMHAQSAPAHSPPPILPFPPTCEPSKLMPYLERTRRTSKPGGVAPLVGNFTAPTWAAAAAAAGAAGGPSGGGAAATQCGGRHHPHSGATSPMSCVSLESNGSHGSAAAAAAAVVVTRSRQGSIESVGSTDCGSYDGSQGTANSDLLASIQQLRLRRMKLSGLGGAPAAPEGGVAYTPAPGAGPGPGPGSVPPLALHGRNDHP